MPILALVENMASFRCDGCEARHYPFGKGHLDAVQASVDAGGSRPVASFSLPIVSNSGGTAEETRPSSRCPSMAETLDALAASLESSTRFLGHFWGVIQGSFGGGIELFWHT